MKKTTIAAFVLIFSLLLSSCVFALPEAPETPTPPINTPDSPSNPDAPDTPDNPTVPDEKDPIKDAEVKDELENWGDSSIIHGNTASITVIKNTPTDITELLSSAFVLDGAVWQSECEEIATVNDGIVTGVKYGRTDIIAEDTLGNAEKITVTVEFLVSSNSGYDFFAVTDDTVYKVESTYEANRLIDLAIMSHIGELTLDFSPMGPDIRPVEDFDIDTEFGNHISIAKKYYSNKPQVLYIEIEYESTAASNAIAQTPQNTYTAIANGNMVIRLDKIANSAYKRADDFEGFKINELTETMDVYNSEELWWALEQGYKPKFAFESSKAELFYERAKMILRDIITEDMNDFEKVIAITEYLTDAVSYDYDAFRLINRPEDDVTTNMCYYLEGVFERGRAVCDGKSKAFVVFCAIEGIPCVRDFGSDPAGGAGHAWNYVYIEGDWYMVDTTGTDAQDPLGSGIANFFGKNVEFMSYEMLFNSVDAHSSDYIYSTVFGSITGAASGDVLTDEVFMNEIYGSNVDFYINSKAEIDAVTELILTTTLCDEAVLSIKIADELKGKEVAGYIDAKCDAVNPDAECQLFSLGEGDALTYIVIIKNILGAD